jgi:hypothetical protein
MMKHLTKLALAATLGVFLMAGDAEACHKNKCNNKCGAPAACAPAPVVCAQPAPCPRPVKTVSCAPRQKKCGFGGLFAGLGHKNKGCAPAPAPAPCTTVAYNYAPTYNYGAPVASGQYITTPQASAQYPVSTPQAPGKMIGTPQR